MKKKLQAWWKLLFLVQISKVKLNYINRLVWNGYFETGFVILMGLVTLHQNYYSRCVIIQRYSVNWIGMVYVLLCQCETHQWNDRSKITGAHPLHPNIRVGLLQFNIGLGIFQSENRLFVILKSILYHIWIYHFHIEDIHLFKRSSMGKF